MRILLFSVLACIAFSTRAIPTPVPAVDADSGLPDHPQLYEAVRHLYRWYMDESDAYKVAGQEEFVFWVRELKPELDPGDQSRIGEVLLPALGIHVRVKKANYRIEELDVVVKNDAWKIVNVGRVGVPEDLPAGFEEVRVKYSDLKDHLFKTRHLAAFPDEGLMERIRKAARNEILKEADPDTLPDGDQTIHLSPLSPVANELWIYWETGQMLIRFASDIDLNNPAVWQHEELAVELYDLDEQVVVSLDEVAGSNAYLTRDQVGRALFNCVVIGKKVVLSPSDTEAK